MVTIFILAAFWLAYSRILLPMADRMEQVRPMNNTCRLIDNLDVIPTAPSCLRGSSASVRLRLMHRMEQVRPACCALL